MKIIVILLAFSRMCLCQFSQTANFPLIQTGIKTGEHKAILTPIGISTTLTKTQDQPFFVTFGSIPQVAIGLLTFEVYTQASNLGYTVQVSGITTTGFISTITALTDTTVNQLKYTYLALASDHSFGYLHQTDLTGFAGAPATSSSAVYTKTLTTSLTFDSTRKYTVSAFLKDFALTKLNNDYSIKVSAQAVLGTNNIQMIVESNCTVVNTSMYVFWIDKTLLESNQEYFIDPGYVVGENNSTKFYQFGFPITIINYYNFMSGGTWMAFNTINETTFSLRFNSYPLYTLRQYKYAYANFLHWRQRVCPTSAYLYVEDQLKCYQACPDRYANNTVQKYCAKCPYSCLNCTYDGACTGCNLTGTHRYLTNSKCLCADKYYDVVNVQECSACHYSCATCQTNSTNCLTCHSTRDWDSITHTCLCKLRFYDTGTNNEVCSACHYTCKTCSSNSNETCLTCDSDKFRTKVLDSCLCQNGYKQDTTAPGIQLCVIVPNLTCSLNCYTCNGTSAHCTGCDPAKKRALSSAQKCQCKSGYTSTSDFNACTQICGDGKVYDENQCDDGNTASGDGCSSTCTIETDFDCNSTVTTQPSICVYKLPYTIILKSINKRPTQNLMDIEFEIKPPPPAGSKASLSNLPLNIVSQSIDTSILRMVAQYTQSIPLRALAKLSLSTIPNSLDFQVKSDNGLAVNYYSTQNYGAYNAQVALVWLYVALVWLGIIVFLIFYHNSLLQITQFIMSVGVTWVGVGTFTRYFLYYQPLLNLRYIFGYNTVVAGQDGMFAYVNYGFILCIAPIILFFIIFSMKRLHRHLVMDQFTKKFVLGEVTFAFLCFNSILVVYGLASQQLTKTRSTPLSIASIVFGIIYLLVILAGSVYFVLLPQSFFYFKDPMFIPKGPRYFISVMIWLKLLTVLAYTLFSFNHQSSSYPPLVVAAMSIINIVVTVLVRPYENNIRVILNQIATALIFMTFFLMLEVPAAEWTGFAVLMVLYVQMIFNYAIIGNGWYKQYTGKYVEEESYSADNKDGQDKQHDIRESGKKLYNIDMDFDPKAAATELKRPQNVDDIDSNLQANRLDTTKRYESMAYGQNSIQHSPYPDQFSSIRKRMFVPQGQEQHTY